MHVSNKIDSDSKNIPVTEKLPESIGSSNFVSCRAIMPVEFDLRKDSQSTNFE